MTLENTKSWHLVPCPLCGGIEQKTILQSENHLFGTRTNVQIKQCICGMLMTNPQPCGDELVSFYSDDSYYTHCRHSSLLSPIRELVKSLQLCPPLVYLRLFIEEHSNVRRYVLRFCPRHFSLRPGMRLLDFGSGSGHFVRSVTRIGLKAIGVEPDPKARSTAEAMGEISFPTLEAADAYIGTDFSGKICGASYDRITILHVLEHVPNPIETLHNLGSRLKKGGRILVTVPNATSRQAIAFSEFWLGYDMPRHLWHFTEDTLGKLIRKAGMTVIHSQTVELAFFAHKSSSLMEKEMGIIPRHEHVSAREVEKMRVGCEIAMVLETAP